MELAAPHEQEMRAQLEEIDEGIERGMQILRDHAQTLDQAQLDKLVETAERLALRLDASLPPEMEPASVAEIRGIMIGARRKLRESEEMGEERQLDVVDDFLVRAESIRHIIRDAFDEEPPIEIANVRTLLKQLYSWLPGLTKKQIAELLGVDPRTVQRWEDGRGRLTHRAQLVVKLVLLLKDAWTAEGVFAWFFRPRRDLDDQRPIDVIDDASYERLLVEAVRKGRAQHAS